MLSRRNAVVQTPFSQKMSSRCKTICCRSLQQLGVRYWLPLRPYDGVVSAFPLERALRARSHAYERVYERVSLGKTIRTRTLHGFACAALALARSREEDFARGPTQILQDRNIYCVYNPHPFPAPCTLPRDDLCPNTGLYRRYDTYPVYTVHTDDDFPVPGIAVVIRSSSIT